MRKRGNIVRYSAEEIAAMIARGEDKTDWERAGAMTQEELERSIAADPDEAGMVVDWASATAKMPQPKAVLNMRVDRRVLDYFQRGGRGYQTRINAVLNAYVDAHERRAAVKPRAKGGRAASRPTATGSRSGRGGGR